MSAFMLSAHALHGAVALGARVKSPSMLRRGSGLFARRTTSGARSVVSSGAVATEEKIDIKVPPQDGTVRVRFAPSPTGNLHVGGARTALFNWLYARNLGGKLILRVEDTDQARSTRESEDAMVRDLKWLGLDWDEGPDCGGPYGPYRQSERQAIYKQLAMQLVEEGHAYPCFCTDKELTMMKEEQEAKKLPPKYTGKWATASEEEVDAEMAKGTPFVYRFRVPEGERIEIDDMIRGKVGWDTDTLGDFVLLRSNGLPVYNFCVAVDDATMGITHVLRAEEHLPNTLRQALVYDALKFPRPKFGHMSLILAPDRSKLSKRHGATSVGQFKDQGYLNKTMINYLSLLGWNDGTEQEIYETEELVKVFSTDRINKSPAVFDVVKLNWMNGQHIRLLPEEEQVAMIGAVLVNEGLAASADSDFVKKAVKLCANGIELVEDAAKEVRDILAYDLAGNVSDEKMKKVLEDDFGEIADAVIAGFESGELAAAIEANDFKKFVNGIGKTLDRKGKRLFMPVRIALTGRMQGPDVGEVLDLLSSEGVPDSAVGLEARVAALKAESAAWAK
jgi:glutamyl-tRNA synthetase|tara:strand:+ start:518 stop:2203 length:1686 start_codon:yes stop_codon:yes gene_type:complete|eukprot:31333-Pelagococcus_subviridis.AAC.5